MNKRILVIMLCAVALTAAGCGSQSENSAASATQEQDAAADVTESAQSENEPVETVEEITPEEAAAAERRKKAEEAAADRYESEDGWSVSYNSELVDLEEGKDYVRFTYNGDANATNRIEFRYFPFTSTDIVLAEATEDYDREDLESSAIIRTPPQISFWLMPRRIMTERIWRGARDILREWRICGASTQTWYRMDAIRPAGILPLNTMKGYSSWESEEVSRPMRRGEN